jgi:hypothetical protein
MVKFYRFKFSTDVNPEDIKAQLALAIVTTECSLGQARVRMDAAYTISEDGRKLVIDVTSDVGRQIAQTFTGLIIRRYGENSFQVKRIRNDKNE